MMNTGTVRGLLLAALGLLAMVAGGETLTGCRVYMQPQPMHQPVGSALYGDNTLTVLPAQGGAGQAVVQGGIGGVPQFPAQDFALAAEPTVGAGQGTFTLIDEAMIGYDTGHRTLIVAQEPGRFWYEICIGVHCVQPTAGGMPVGSVTQGRWVGMLPRHQFGPAEQLWQSGMLPVGRHNVMVRCYNTPDYRQSSLYGGWSVNIVSGGRYTSRIIAADRYCQPIEGLEQGL